MTASKGIHLHQLVMDSGLPFATAGILKSSGISQHPVWQIARRHSAAFSQPSEALTKQRTTGCPLSWRRQATPRSVGCRHAAGSCREVPRFVLGEAGANFLIFRTHWSGMPVAQALASMRLISDALLPALHRITPAGG